MGDQIEKRLDTEVTSNIANSAKAAWKESFGRSLFWQKLNPLNLFRFPIIFFKTYVSESLKVQKDKKTVTEDSTKQLTATVLDLPTKDLSKKFKDEFKKDIGDSDELDEDEERDLDTFSTVLVESLRATGNSGKAVGAIDKILKTSDKVTKGTVVDEREALELVSVGIFTLVEFKNKFNSERKLRNYLENLADLAKKSPKAKKILSYMQGNLKKHFNFDKENFPASIEKHGDKLVKFLDEIRDDENPPDLPDIAKLVFLIETEELIDVANKIAPRQKDIGEKAA